MIGRWNVIDPLLNGLSPYNYVENNPIRNIQLPSSPRPAVVELGFGNKNSADGVMLHAGDIINMEIREIWQHLKLALE